MDYAILPSPVGPLLLVGDASGLHRIAFSSGRQPFVIDPELRRNEVTLGAATAQLRAYFAGERRAFDLPLQPRGTPFQREVWACLREIPYATTISYGELARRIGSPRASRAVGAANGRNPLAIIVPCHRVIGSNGSLTGFGGGIAAKRALLALEQNQGGLFALQ